MEKNKKNIFYEKVDAEKSSNDKYKYFTKNTQNENNFTSNNLNFKNIWHNKTNNEKIIKDGNIKEQKTQANFDNKTDNNTQYKNNFPKNKINKIILKKKKEYKKIKSYKIANKINNVENDKTIVINDTVTLYKLSELLKVNINIIIEKCRELDFPVSVYQEIDKNMISLLAEEFGYKVIFENIFEKYLNCNKDKKNDFLHKKPPVVTILGHVDHGKTTLLDYICKSSIAKNEAGGITQHIRAYKIKTKNDNEMTFIDTPGHEIFTAMRARGVEIADIIIVVIAADSGVQPQTVEILKQIQILNKPVIFAINKIDKDTSKIDKIKDDLHNLNFTVEDWGGKYQCQNISALNGIGIDDLLEKIIIETDIIDLKADYNCYASGVILDSNIEFGNGKQNKILIQNGKLKTGDFIVAGPFYGKIREIRNIFGEKTTEAYPSEPVSIIGLNGCAKSGEKFIVTTTKKTAEDLAFEHSKSLSKQVVDPFSLTTFETFKKNINKTHDAKINIIIKADFDGSIQALSDFFFKMSSDEYEINIVESSIGDIFESDILSAEITKSIIIGFNVKISKQILNLAEKKNVSVKIFSVIYDIGDYIKEKINSYLNKDKNLICVAKAEIKDVFDIRKVGKIAGCIIKEGIAHSDDTVYILRDNKKIFTGKIKSFKHYKTNIKQAKVDTECGICFHRFEDFKKGDTVEFIKDVPNKE